MKNIFKTTLAFVFALSLAACYSDDSDLGGRPVGDIEIDGLEDSYTCMAYTGERLKINPTVNAGYDEGKMNYTWMLLNKNTGSLTAEGDTIQPTVISNEKNLDFEVNVSPGVYQLRFVAQAPNGYYKIDYATVNVQTAFSQGFYVLKETTDGNTDLDLLTAKDEVASNIYTSVFGAPLSGKPGTLNAVYASYYINEETNEMEQTNFVSVATEDGQLHVNRLTDFKQIFGNDNICYDPIAGSEKVVSYFYGAGLFYHNILCTTKGVYSSDFNSSECTGQFGDCSAVMEGESPTRHFVWDAVNYGAACYWSDESKMFYSLDYSVFPEPMMLYGDEDTDYSGFSCLTCNINRTAGDQCVFVMDDAVAGKRWVYMTFSSMMGQMYTGRVELPATLHVGKASAYAVCYSQAQYVYAIDENKLWAANFSSDSPNDIELSLNGIGAGEELTFVTNQSLFGVADDFDYLIVGTQKGNNYKLYMYEMNGGVPQGDPVKTISGEGKVKSVRYLYPSFSGFMFNYGYQGATMND